MEKLDTHSPKPSPVSKVEFSSLSKDIILTLLYFDIFNYPLNSTELLQHSRIKDLTEDYLNKELEKLIVEKKIQQDRGFFFLPTPEKIVDRRISGNRKAAEYVQKAMRVSKFIAAFPYVQGIFLSGSVSKGYADQDSDIDYFIVTDPGRLWLTRTMLILYKKIFLLNSRKYFCLNYFVDKQHLEIQDKNLFTAIELAYLLPVYNEEIYDTLRQQNEWMASYLPNFKNHSYAILPSKPTSFRKGIEKILSGSIGNTLDDFCLSFTEKFWRYKFRNTSSLKGSGINCKKHVSKFHPQNFQNKILDNYYKKIEDYNNLYSIKLLS